MRCNAGTLSFECEQVGDKVQPPFHVPSSVTLLARAVFLMIPYAKPCYDRTCLSDEFGEYLTPLRPSFLFLLDASTHLYKRLRPSARPLSVLCLSIRLSVCQAVFFLNRESWSEIL